MKWNGHASRCGTLRTRHLPRQPAAHSDRGVSTVRTVPCSTARLRPEQISLRPGGSREPRVGTKAKRSDSRSRLSRHSFPGLSTQLCRNNETTIPNEQACPRVGETTWPARGHRYGHEHLTIEVQAPSPQIIRASTQPNKGGKSPRRHDCGRRSAQSAWSASTTGVPRRRIPVRGRARSPGARLCVVLPKAAPDHSSR